LSNAARVTWLIPVKNGMPYVEEALESIALQTCQCQRVIVWDNGSTDGTVDAARSWIPKRIDGAVVSDKPLPLATSRAELVKAADSEYCALLDADDVAVPDRLARQIAFMDSHPEVSVLGGQIKLIDSKSRVIGNGRTRPLTHEHIVDHMLYDMCMVNPSLILRRGDVLRAGNFGDYPCEDFELCLRMARSYRLHNLDEIVTRYRVHTASTTEGQRREGTLRSIAVDLIGKHSADLYGIPGDVAIRLGKRGIRPAWPVFMKVANHLAAQRHCTVRQVMDSPWFIQSMIMLTPPTDVSTYAKVLAQRNGLAVVAQLGRYVTRRRVEALLNRIR